MTRLAGSSFLDVSAEIIEETPVKIKPQSPRSYAEDVVKRLSSSIVAAGIPHLYPYSLGHQLSIYI